MSTELALSPAIYLPECLYEAAAAYQGLCSVKVISESPAEYAVKISPLEGISDENRLVHEFLNYLLDLSLETHLSKLQGTYGTDGVPTA